MVCMAGDLSGWVERLSQRILSLALRSLFCFDGIFFLVDHPDLLLQLK